MRVAVTGAGGFIGAAACAALRAAGHDVLALARPGGHQPPPGVAVLQGDLRDPVALERLVADADAIVHAAAWVHRSTARPDDRARCFEINAGGTRALLAAAEHAGRRARVVFVSTISVYGPVFENVREDAPVGPENAYGESKLEAERAVLAAHASGASPGVVLRPCAVYGRHAPGNFQRLVALMRFGIAPLVGGGAARKSFAHVDDVAAAIVRAAERPEAPGHVYNVAGDALAVRAMCDAYARGIGRRVRYIPVPEMIATLFAWKSRFVAEATGGRTPDFGRPLEVLMGDNTVDASAIVRDLGATFRSSAEGLEASVRET